MMTRRIPAALVLLVLLGGCSRAEIPDTATTTDPAAIAAWELKALRQRAAQGDMTAQHNLGRRYYRGEGVPQDDAEAAAWYRKAADQGDPHAQYNLGVLYGEGQGVPQDDAQAVAWTRKAADQGEPRAVPAR